MSDTQKYYYMRLRADFFKRNDIKLIEGMQDGTIYCLMLLKLLAASLEHNGHLLLNGDIIMTPEMLAKVTDYEVGTVERALKVFMQLGLVEQLPDNSYFMLELEGMVGKTSNEADRKRIKRQEIKQLVDGETADKCPPKVRHLSDKYPPEIDIEKETDIKSEIDSERELYGRYRNVSLTHSEYKELKADYPKFCDEYIEKLSSYMEQTGKTYKNHIAVLRSGLKQDIDSKKPDYTCEEGETL